MDSLKYSPLFDILGREYAPLQPTAGRPLPSEIPALLLPGSSPLRALLQETVAYWNSSPLLWAFRVRHQTAAVIVLQRDIGTLHEPLPPALETLVDPKAVEELAMLEGRRSLVSIRYEIVDHPSGPSLSISLLRGLGSGNVLVYGWSHGKWRLADAPAHRPAACPA